MMLLASVAAGGAREESIDGGLLLKTRVVSERDAYVLYTI
jgi:hypothetical protein